jgi:signal peptidase I
MQVILGNFALILFTLMVLTGVIWLYDVLVLAKQRRRAAEAALAEFDRRQQSLAATANVANAVAPVHARPDLAAERRAVEQAALRQPAWVEYSGSFFPVIALVFVLRSFLFEPFKIPSSSMVPTLLVGDFILVNKFTYGIRLPIINQKVVELNDPQRGDVMVFKYPKDMSQDYIKRVIGVPGDKITYENKRLTVNGQPAQYQPLEDYLDDEQPIYHKQFTETLGGVSHRILMTEGRRSFEPLQVENFPQHEACTYSQEKFTCIVPPGNYFMMGDNRDNSADSRYWGFVPDKNIVGKATAIWLNLSHPRRSFSGIH